MRFNDANTSKVVFGIVDEFKDYVDKKKEDFDDFRRMRIETLRMIKALPKSYQDHPIVENAYHLDTGKGHHAVSYAKGKIPELMAEAKKIIDEDYPTAFELHKAVDDLRKRISTIKTDVEARFSDAVALPRGRINKAAKYVHDLKMNDKTTQFADLLIRQEVELQESVSAARKRPLLGRLKWLFFGK